MASEELETCLNMYMAHLRVEKGYAFNTLEAYQRDLASFFDFLALSKLTKLTEIS
ncbi:MAG: site-specific integrase, partial [Deltaproteobacteria bacterium]|nr:site-specific integrase [Deltaproteobacteria bacterium]